MSARDDLRQYVDPDACGEEEIAYFETLVDDLLREHAHGLAEKIRTFDHGLVGSLDDGLAIAADLIDPIQGEKES